MTTELPAEGYPYIGTFVKSPWDGEVYCRKNGDFVRHMRTRGITSYSELIQQLHPELVKHCKCGAVCSLNQSTMTFLSCCGSVACTIDARRRGLRERPLEKKRAHLLAIKQAIAKIPEETLKQHQLQRTTTGHARGSYKKSVKKRESTCQYLYGDKKYNNSEKISTTKLHWTDDQRQSFLTKLKIGLGGKNLCEFQNEETWSTKRKKLEEAGRWIPLDLLEPWKRYNKVVRFLTERTYRQNRHIINPHDLPRKTGGDGYHLDHKMPIAYGFANDIPVEQIAALNNLQMLPWFDNISKGKKYDPPSN